jgi:hypothetical protein
MEAKAVGILQKVRQNKASSEPRRSTTSGSLVLSDYAKTRDGFPSTSAKDAVYRSNGVSPAW